MLVIWGEVFKWKASYKFKMKKTLSKDNLDIVKNTHKPIKQIDLYLKMFKIT